MKFEYSKDPKIVERIKKIKNIKLIYNLIEVFFLLTIINFSLVSSFDFITLLVLAVITAILCGVMNYICNNFIANIITETLVRELNPKLFIDCNIYLYNKSNKKLRNYILCDIATGYLYDGNFDKCEEILVSLEEQKIDKTIKIIILQQKMVMYYFKRKYKKALELKQQLLSELENYEEKIKDQILFNMEMYSALIEEDKDKLSVILKILKKSSKNLDKVDYLYIKSQFFEEEDNKYQKKLAFEGGDIFYAREELEDQSITTKNNIKPNKYKGFKVVSISILCISIITTILSFVAYFV